MNIKDDAALGWFFSTRCARTTRTTLFSTFVNVRIFGLPGSVRSTTYLPAGSVRSLNTNEKGICTSIRSRPCAFTIQGATVIRQIKTTVAVTSCFTICHLHVRVVNPSVCSPTTRWRRPKGYTDSRGFAVHLAHLPDDVWPQPSTSDLCRRGNPYPPTKSRMCYEF
jgi:hypothetical protein